MQRESKLEHTWGSARRRKSRERLLVNHLRETKVGNQQIRVLVLASEEKILGFQIWRGRPMIRQSHEKRETRVDTPRWTIPWS
jgi:hypothetical protein